MSRIPFVSWSWKEGRVWDNWMIVHLLSGTIIACFTTLLGMETLHAYLLAIGLMVSWEIGEMVGGIREEIENLLIDIIVGMFGFFLLQTWILPMLSRDATWWTLIFLFSIGLAGGLAGWIAYKERSE